MTSTNMPSGYTTYTPPSFASYSFYATNLNNTDHVRKYFLSDYTDQVLAIVLPVLTIPGLFMNVMVLWNLFVKTSALNKPTRQLHGQLVISNFIFLIVCVPSISIVLYNGRSYFGGLGAKSDNYLLNPIFCNISGYIFNVMMRMTMHISTALAVDRLIAVQFPIFHKFKVQQRGYNWLIIIMWVFNAISMGTPFYIGKIYRQMAYECVCTWNFEAIMNIAEMPWLHTLALLFYYALPFTFTNLLTIACCIWVIVLLLKKNLVVSTVKKRGSFGKSTKNGNLYERLTPKKSLEEIKENGHSDEETNRKCNFDFDHQNATKTQSDKTNVKVKKARPSSTLSVRSNLSTILSPVAMLKNSTSISLSADAKVKRACTTMLIVIALQLICYSVIQMMVVDLLLFHIFKKNYFHNLTHTYPEMTQVFINYPLYLLVFSILIPAVIHFRMTRRLKKSSINLTTHARSTVNAGASKKVP